MRPAAALPAIGLVAKEVPALGGNCVDSGAEGGKVVRRCQDIRIAQIHLIGDGKNPVYSIKNIIKTRIGQQGVIPLLADAEWAWPKGRTALPYLRGGRYSSACQSPARISFKTKKASSRL